MNSIINIIDAGFICNSYITFSLSILIKFSFWFLVWIQLYSFFGSVTVQNSVLGQKIYYFLKNVSIFNFFIIIYVCVLLLNILYSEILIYLLNSYFISDINDINNINDINDKYIHMSDQSTSTSTGTPSDTGDNSTSKKINSNSGLSRAVDAGIVSSAFFIAKKAVDSNLSIAGKAAITAGSFVAG